MADHKEFAQRTDYSDEIKKIIEDPEYIVQGWEGELIAMRWCEIAPKTPKYLCVVYRELNGEGFVITAFFISRFEKLLRRKILWQK
ncbi:MAG: hypothetical protein AB1478_07705 [Nitrospirota bacterium]